MAKEIHSGGAAFATPNPQDADAKLLAAWERRTAAYEAYNALPHPAAASAEEQAQLDIVDVAEEHIRRTAAQTPRGVEIKLWVALQHMLPERDDDAAVNAENLGWFTERESSLDWHIRFIVSAIQSLRAMVEDHADVAPGWDAHDWLERFKAVGGALHPASVGVTMHGRPMADQQAARGLIDEIEADPARMAAVRALANEGSAIGGAA